MSEIFKFQIGDFVEYNVPPGLLEKYVTETDVQVIDKASIQSVKTNPTCVSAKEPRSRSAQMASHAKTYLTKAAHTSSAWKGTSTMIPRVR